MRIAFSPLFAFALALWLASAGVHAETYYVRANGNDRADGKSPQTALKTIQAAAWLLNHGDSIVIGPGLYKDNILLAERFAADNSPMAIAGDESGKLTGDAPGPVAIMAADQSHPALRIHRFRNLAVSGLTFMGPGEGLLLEKCRQTRIERCTFSNLRRGLAVRLSEDLRVESSVFERCISGVALQNTARVRLAHLTLVNNRSSAILLLSCANGEVRNSILAANNTNFLVDAVSASTWVSDHNVIHGSSGPWGLCPLVYYAHEWFSASGQDRHSIYVPPLFVDPAKGDFHIDPEVRWGGGLPGRLVGQRLEPAIQYDRDGKPFPLYAERTCCGAYAYPEPKPAAGWKRLPVALKPENGKRQSAGIYRPDGMLVRMLVADATGIEDLWWDGLDDAGQPVSAADLEVRSAIHDVRIMDDGNFGDNGNPLGTYNADNPERVLALPDGRFVVATSYDEAGIPLRFHAASGQSYAGVNLAEKDIWAMVLGNECLVAGIGLSIAMINLEGDRIRMPNGVERYAILAEGEKLPDKTKPTGLAVIDDKAYVALPGLDIVRVMRLADGAKVADWPAPAVSDLAADETKTLWAISGKEIVAFNENGEIVRKIATGLEEPRYLAVANNRIAAIDRQAGRLALLAVDSKSQKIVGRPAGGGVWHAVAGDVFCNPRGIAWLPDGRLLMAEAGRVRAIWPDTCQISFTAESNFMDVAVPHPQKPEYVYCHGGMAFRVDLKTGAWQRVLEAPGIKGLGSLSTNVVLGGKPFLVAWDALRVEKTVVNGKEQARHISVFYFIDVVDPLKPRLAAQIEGPHGGSYVVCAFTQQGDLVLPGPGTPKGGYGLRFTIVPFKGLDAQGAPQYDFAAAKIVGPVEDASPRGMAHNKRFTVDRTSGEFYYTAVTKHHNKMVPAWGASATGAGKSKPDGTPLWFSLSSGGNATSMGVLNDGKNTWFFVPKDFGGQTDVYDSDGLRIATGNWSWPSNWQMGFVDLCFAFQPYLRPDGKPGAWVEDDYIGRFTRIRLDGGETYAKHLVGFAWPGSDTPAGPAPMADRIAGGKHLQQAIALPKVPEMQVDGDWGAWSRAGVAPQIVSLPTPTWGRSWPDDLLQTFRAGAGIGALAHDGKSLYVYFVVTDDTQHFDAEHGGMMWAYDSIELWLEEEQLGLGFLKNGRPCLYKYRYHNREGKEWAANYPLPDDCIWGMKLDSLASHPLGRMLAESVGAKCENRPGYALMARIPFAEIRLKGGLPDSPERGGTVNLPCTGNKGEIIRVGVAFDGINAWGREQDFKIYWPLSLMYADPTRNMPFVCE